MRRYFEEQLNQLKSSLVQMGDAAANQIKQAFDALATHDVILAKKVIEADDIIDDMEQSIEQTCLRIIVKEQPVARDLRTITAALKMITDIERVGDHASDISALVIDLKPFNEERNLPIIASMTELSQTMLSQSIQAFVNEDIVLATETMKLDLKMNAYFASARHKIIDLITSQSIIADVAIYYMMIVKYLERIGDHTVNMCEWLIFSLTGDHKNRHIL